MEEVFATDPRGGGDNQSEQSEDLMGFSRRD